MQISSRLSIAIHIILCTAYYETEEKITSTFLAKSINVNPVIIRNILQQLKTAEIISVTRGVGGARIIKDLADLSMYDIYQAVEVVSEEKLFALHKNPNLACEVGLKMKNILTPKFNQVQLMMELEMKKINLNDLFQQI